MTTVERSGAERSAAVATCPTCHQHYEDASFCPRDGSRLIGEIVLGSVVGERYRLVRKVGEGAMGEVYEAEHVHMRRKVAVKVLHRKFAADADAIARLRREAESTGTLAHPNIVEAIDFGRSADGHVYLVMEWLDGETLEVRIARGALDLHEAIDIAMQAAKGIALAHARGIVHRDIKPANLFLARERDGHMVVKLLDFGIAKLALDQNRLTGTGAVIGTPNYMAPEQALADHVDGRADQYGLGVILYEMIAGEPPFLADTALAVLHQHTSSPPVRLGTRVRPRRIPAALEATVMRCLEKAPAARFPSMDELIAALSAIDEDDEAARTNDALVLDPGLDAPATRTRRWPIPVLSIAVLVLAGLLAFHLANDRSTPRAASVDGHDGRPSAVVEARARHATATVIVTPATPAPEQPFELSILLRDIDPMLSDPIAAGRLIARLTLTRAGDRTAAHESMHHVEREGRFSVGLDLPSAGAYEGELEFSSGGRVLDGVRFVLFGDADAHP